MFSLISKVEKLHKVPNGICPKYPFLNHLRCVGREKGKSRFVIPIEILSVFICNVPLIFSLQYLLLGELDMCEVRYGI